MRKNGSLALHQHDFARGQVSIFYGQEGLEKLLFKHQG
jgi:hypothetical protein